MDGLRNFLVGMLALAVGCGVFMLFILAQPWSMLALAVVLVVAMACVFGEIIRDNVGWW